jgi:RNA polymerase sigma-70 factor (ECF subfamily)
MQQPDISNLLKECRRQNETAFRRLVEMYQGVVYSFAFRMLCNEDDAKDAVQETFIKVWKNIHKYDPGLKFTTWLFAIASNLCCDKLRFRKRRQNTGNIESIHFALVTDNLENTVSNSDLARIIHTLTDKLTPKQKLIFTLRDLQELEVDEVEKITGMSAGKIKSNLYLARQFIKEQLEKY